MKVHGITVGQEQTSELAFWLALYKEEFVELDPRGFSIPKARPGTWFVIADERVSASRIYNVCRKHFSCEKSFDLDTVKDTHLTGTTCRFFKAVLKPDEEQKNRSANDLQKLGLTPRCITLKECLLLELWYWKKTSKHLDGENWTSCVCSRCQDGSVPRVSSRRSGGCLDVAWALPTDKREFFRPRVAVL